MTDLGKDCECLALAQKKEFALSPLTFCLCALTKGEEEEQDVRRRRRKRRGGREGKEKGVLRKKKRMRRAKGV